MTSTLVIAAIVFVFSSSLALLISIFLFSHNSTNISKEYVGEQLVDLVNKSGSDSKKVFRDLDLVGKSYGEFIYEKATSALIFFVVTFLLFTLGFENALWGVISGMFFGFLGWFLPSNKLKKQVEEERHQMRQSINIFEELGAVAIAGGAEVNSALRNAAQFGSGNSWRKLRSAVRNSLHSNSTFSSEIEKLSRLYELTELENLSNLLSTTERGGVAQVSLEDMSEQQAKIASQDALDTAEKNSSRMIMAIALMFGSFVLFIFFIVMDGLAEISI